MSRDRTALRGDIRDFMEALSRRANITPEARRVLDEDQKTTLARAEIARKVIMQEDIRDWGQVIGLVRSVFDFYDDNEQQEMRNMSHRDRIAFLALLSNMSNNTVKKLSHFLKEETSGTTAERAQNIINILAFGDGESEALTSEEAHMERKARQNVRGFVNQFLLNSAVPSTRSNDDDEQDQST